MREVRWEAKWNDTVVVTVLYELLRVVGTVTIEYKKTSTAHLGLGRVLVKVLDPVKGDPVVRITSLGGKKSSIRV